MNHPNHPHAPPSGQTLVQGGPPQYVTASPPGVAVALPNSGQNQYPQAGYPPPQQYAQPQQAAPANPSGRNDELLQNAGKTVYEFRGDHSEERRSGGRHQTFFADNANLASIAITEERQHSNLKGGGVTTWLITGVVIFVVGGLVWFFMGSSPDASASKEAKGEQASAEASAPAVAPSETPSPEAETPSPEAATPTEEPATPPAEEPKPPAEEPKPVEDPQPAADEPKPEPKPEPTPEPKKTTPAKKNTSPPKPKPKPEPEPKVPSISPSKPPRALDGLPAPD